MRELSSRIVFDVYIGNIDDHARNHAAFWGGERDSRLRVCLDAAVDYHLDRLDADSIIDYQRTVITEQWSDAADAAELPEAQRQALWQRQVLNPFIRYDYQAPTSRRIVTTPWGGPDGPARTPLSGSASGPA